MDINRGIEAAVLTPGGVSWECCNGYHLICAEGKQKRKMVHIPHAFGKEKKWVCVGGIIFPQDIWKQLLSWICNVSGHRANPSVWQIAARREMNEHFSLGQEAIMCLTRITASIKTRYRILIVLHRSREQGLEHTPKQHGNCHFPAQPPLIKSQWGLLFILVMCASQDKWYLNA